MASHMLKTCKQILLRWKYTAAFYVALATLLWWLLPPRPDIMLRAEPDVVLQAWSADGRVLAFASEDRLMFWELPNCRVLAVSAPEVVDGRRVGFSSSKLDPLGAFAYVTRVKRRAKDGES